MCGLQWYVGWRQFVQVFVFSSIVTADGNGSIRAAICIQRLGCLSVKNVSIAVTGRPDKSPHMPNIKCRHHLEDKRD